MGFKCIEGGVADVVQSSDPKCRYCGRGFRAHIRKQCRIRLSSKGVKERERERGISI